MDRFTPCVPKPTEQHVRRNFNNSGLASQKNLLQQLSTSISLHEDRLVTLTRNLDINLDNHDNADCASETSDPSLRFPYGTTVQHNGRNSRKHILVPDPHPRPGRLSPSVLEMVFSPNNISGFSAGSSGADTSYDSGLYRWLGVGEFPVLESSPQRPLGKSIDLSEPNDSNPNTSTDSSQSAYSQPSLRSLSSIDHNILPLSPPATVRPPFAESLERDRKGSENSHSHTGNSGALVGSSEELAGTAHEYSTIFHEFAGPFMFLKNISLQHYLPSATVLRHFQRVIDELRGKYAVSDQGNNMPSQWIRRRRSNRQSITPSLQSSHDISSSLSLRYKAPQDLDFACTSADIPGPLQPQKSESRTTRELYIELAGILFEQVAQDEVKIEKLKGLAERLDKLSQKKRTTALVICMRGRANTKNHA